MGHCTDEGVFVGLQLTGVNAIGENYCFVTLVSTVIRRSLRVNKHLVCQVHAGGTQKYKGKQGNKQNIKERKKMNC